MDNVQCLKCGSEWHETSLKTLRGKEVDGKRIAFKGGAGWKEIKCIVNECKGQIVRKEVNNIIADFQLNEVSSRNNYYYQGKFKK